MKRILSFLLALVMVMVLFTGCGGGNTLNGIKISEYTIVYDKDAPDYCQRAAEYIRDQIKLRTEIEVPVQEADSGTYPHEILVGDTDRALSQSLKTESRNMEFYITADDSHIALNAHYFIIAAAAYYFVETYIPKNNFKTAVPTGEITTAQPITEKANNFIFLIGDGMGFNQTKLFEYYSVDRTVTANDGEDIFYGYYLPYQGKIRTNSLSGTTDSAAGGTALATGYKTINSYVGRDKDLNDIQSLTELAGSLGKSTAVMSTDLVTGATPAAFSSHADDRNDSQAILAGQDTLTQTYNTILLCGLNSSVQYQDDITEVLTNLDSSEKGFFLMYEEGYIDKHCHNWSLSEAFDCMVRFNQAIGLFMEYAFYHPDTMLLITADHETGGLSYLDGKPDFFTNSHTAADVPIFAYGQGAEVFQDYDKENNEVPKVLAALWGVSDFGG